MAESMEQQDKPDPWWMQETMHSRSQTPDASVYVHGGSIKVRKRRDGFTRVEVSIHDGNIRYDGQTPWFVWYLTDDERREIAATFALEGDRT